MRPYHLLLACTLVLTFTACGRKKPKAAPTPAAVDPGPPADDVRALQSDARLYYDDTEVFGDSTRMIIRDPESLENIWNRAASGQASAPPLPAIDWSRHMVLLVSAGQMHPGDQIRVDSVGTRNGRMVAVVRTTVECQPFPASAYPFEIVRVPRTDEAVTFIERRAEEGDCGH